MVFDENPNQSPIGHQSAFDNEPKFGRPQFINFSDCIDEKDIRNTFYCNICKILNVLLPDYKFLRQLVSISGGLRKTHIEVIRPITPLFAKTQKIIFCKYLSIQ